MSETLKFGNETIQENSSTNIFKEAFKILKEQLNPNDTEKQEKKDIEDVKIDIIKKFFENNKDKTRDELTQGTNWESGALITATQIALKSLNYDPNGIDGWFGAKTNGALQAFKTDHSITESYIGPLTMNALYTELNKPADQQKKFTGENITPVEVVKDQKGTNNNKTENMDSADTTKIKPIIINSIDEITNPTRPEKTIKIVMFNGKQYGFFNNGRVGILNKETKLYENMQNTKDVINKIENKKNNLIKQLELKDIGNGFYEKTDMKGIYMITNNGKIIYSGPDYGNKIFIGPKSDNRKNITEKEIPINLKKETIIKSMSLKKEGENKYSKKGLTGFYAFGNDNNLYYSGIDEGNKVFLGYTNNEGEVRNEINRRTGENTQRKDCTIPNEIDYISI